MNEEQFNELLKRYQRGEASQEEVKLVESWLESRSKQNIYGQLSEDELRAIKASIHQKIHSGLEEEKRERGPLLVRRFMFRAAAAVILLVAAGLFAWKFDLINLAEPPMAVTQSTGDVQKIILDDGSIVWLKGESTLRYPERFKGDERVVELEGEALFEISKSFDHPSLWGRIMGAEPHRRSFVVKAGAVQTRVLGTSFNVKSNSEETEVYVLTGKVEVKLEEGTGLELLPNERSVYQRSDPELKKYGEVQASIDSIRQIDSFHEITKGTEYNMYFENVAMGAVAQKISQKFDVKVEVADEMESCLIRADFTDQSLENTLDLIAETMNGAYKIDKDIVYLYGTTCE